jgi:hypothetical protein
MKMRREIMPNKDELFQIHILEIENKSLKSQLESANKIIQIQSKQLTKVEEFINKL